ncbi:MAG: flagellar biosynthesis protein FlhB [Spirochaetales bacterium]|nr:flagellar biosynthesis protein FlhB [Spirochaetales bacterium]
MAIYCFQRDRTAVYPLPGRLPLSESAFNMDLQWFAAEDEGRTEEPTEQKLRKAREDGKVAKSADLTSALILLFAVITLAVTGKYMMGTMKEMLQFFLSRAPEIDASTTRVLATAFFNFYFRIIAPIVIVSFVAALMGNILQVGFLFTTKPITPDFSKIVPKIGKWFQRSFASSEAAFNLMKSIVKVAIIAALAYLNITSKLQDIVDLLNGTFLTAIQTVAGLAFRIMLEAAILMLVFALADYYFQKKQHLESLKMSKHEIKEERKQADGDPLVKGRLKQRMRDLLSNNMMRNVPEADVVVTNPTHFAVAMQYKYGGEMPAPRVVAKGQDNIALKIREIAGENNVPIIENRPLARALYAEVEIGEVIPEQYYETMAIIIKQVYEMKGISLEAV